MVTIPVKDIKSVGKKFLQARIDGIITENPHMLEADIIKRVFNKSKNQIKEVVTNIARGSLRAHPTYVSITAELYNGDFGFEPGTAHQRMEDIIQAIIGNTEVEMYTQSNLMRITYKVDRDAIYEIDAAIVHNDTQELDWLKWLLEKGSTKFIQDFHIVFDSFTNPPSRSEEAIMAKGGYWGVPDQIAGTYGNNWITQSLGFGESGIRYPGSAYSRTLKAIKQILIYEINHLNV
jgi:hypothetical protein